MARRAVPARRAGVVRVSAPPLFALTDEEVLALTGRDSGPVVLPHLAGLRASERELAQRTAERSLAARQVIVPAPGPDSEPDRHGTGVRVSAPVRPVLELRAGAPVVVVLHRLLGAPATTSSPTGTPPGPPSSVRQPHGSASLSRYLHVVDAVVLTEDVTEHGVHTFGLTIRDELPAVIAEFLIPPDASPGKAAVELGSDDPAQTLSALCGPTVLAEFAVLDATRRGPPPASTVALGPGGCYSSIDGRAFNPVAPDELVGSLVRDVVAAERAVAAAVTAAGREDGAASAAGQGSAGGTMPA